MQDSIDSILDVEETDQESDKQLLDGLCLRCMNTGFVIKEKDGMFGVTFTSRETDSLGQPVRKLQVCGHEIKLRF